MPDLPRVKMIVATRDGARLYAAMEAAIAMQALGRQVTIFFQGEAVAALTSPIAHAGDAARVAAGQPDLAWMVQEATEMEIALIVCQSGMAMQGLTVMELAPLVQVGGLIGFLAKGDPTDPLIVY